jgi:hypothetical protein
MCAYNIFSTSSIVTVCAYARYIYNKINSNNTINIIYTHIHSETLDRLGGRRHTHFYIFEYENFN